MNIESIRNSFPSLKGDTVFLENAGGSQVPHTVIESISQFMVDSYAQTGVAYPESERATQMVDYAHQFLNTFFNGSGLGEVAIGSSTTGLFYILGNCFSEVLKAGDEVVVSVTNHESHVGPWVRLEKLGVKVIWWGVDSESGLGSLKELEEIMSDRVKLVCFTQTCNLTGDRVDVTAVSEIAHRYGALSVVDCVAAAPHELPDVAKWNCDFACVSLYKIYGPHFGAMWGKHSAWEGLHGPNHFFLPRNGAKPFEIGCLPYELLAGLKGLEHYFCTLGSIEEFGRVALENAFLTMSSLEKPLLNRLSSFFEEREDLWLIGPKDGAIRHPTYGFVHETLKSSEIVERVIQKGIAIRFGHMYAYRLCERLGIDLTHGVVRVSAVHYNSENEVDRLISALKEIF